MQVLESRVDRASGVFIANRNGNLAFLSALRQQEDLALLGGGEKYVARHRGRGKLLARERIELLVDQDAPFLELSTVAAWGTPFAVGASVVSGIGVVSGVECMLLADDPTVRGGSTNPYSWRKIIRSLQIARENRLPLIHLVESGGGDLRNNLELFLPAGKLFHDLTALSAARIPVIALVFGNSTAGGAYVPGMCDYSVMVKGGAKVFLGGPPLVKMATGEVSTDEELGGAEMHSRTSGLSDYFAETEVDCIRIGRDIIAHLNWRKAGPAPRPSPAPPQHDPEDLLGVVSVDIKQPFDPREVIGRVVDGSAFEEYKSLYGTSLVTGWASIHGFPVGILANARGVIFTEEAQKATEFILLNNQIDVPLIFMQNTTGYIVGKQYEQRGIIKDGAKMINAVSNSMVPHITLNMAASYGAGNFGMCGRAYDPRFLFSWPNSKLAMMGPEQLAGVMSIVARDAAKADGRDFDEAEDARRHAELADKIERESLALTTSGQLYDDGIIDPRDTRSVLGISLSACHSNEVKGRSGFGVFRM